MDLGVSALGFCLRIPWTPRVQNAVLCWPIFWVLTDFGVSARFSVDATRALHGEGELDKGL